jgi:hypothetical protein
LKLTDGERYPDALYYIFRNKRSDYMGSFINSYSKEELASIVECSFSYVEVLSKLGYSATNGHNSKTLKNRLNYYNISTEHFTYKSRKTNWTDEEIFCENSKVSQSKLRKTFQQREFIPYQCNICGLEPFWNGQPLVLTLDHKNGKNKDNRIENLQWVCPNCDRQSDTYGMKNKKKLKKDVVLHPGNYDNNQQKVERNKKQKSKNEKITVPNRMELKNKLWELKNFTSVGNYYNVSPTQIRRWCRAYNLPATINILKYTSEIGWQNENWDDIPRLNIVEAEMSKPCYMVDKETDEILMEFSSYAEAGRYIRPGTKKASIHIGKVCSGDRQTAYGYKWIDKNI